MGSQYWAECIENGNKSINKKNLPEYATFIGPISGVSISEVTHEVMIEGHVAHALITFRCVQNCLQKPGNNLGYISGPTKTNCKALEVTMCLCNDKRMINTGKKIPKGSFYKE